MPRRSSRQRYNDYLDRRRDKATAAREARRSRRRAGSDAASQNEPHATHAGADSAFAGRERRKRLRSFRELFGAFLGLMRGHRLVTAMALATLTVSTAIGLVMPASTKIAIDYVLTNNPGPSGIPDWFPGPREPRTLLWLIFFALVATSVVSICIGLWGRWQVTRISKRVQVGVRKRLFEHAVRLPLDRVQDLKSGGVASLLREDAGNVGGLLFSLIYNPWRAVIQLAGTLCILAWVDWRMLAGAVVLIPVVWLSHRTWISKIRPMYRDIRDTRTAVDAHATEAFGGMRVVRGFARQTGEATRFVTGGHVMSRQEILTWWFSRVLELLWAALIPLASAGVLVYAGTGVIEGRLTLGDLMMFSAYLLMLLGPLESLVSTAQNVQNELSGLDRVLEVLDEKREFERGDGEKPGLRLDQASVAGRITLEHVSFAYPARRGLRAGAMRLEKDTTSALKDAPRPAAEQAGNAKGAKSAKAASNGVLPQAGTGAASGADASPSDSGPSSDKSPAPVLEDITLDIAPGETIALVGPSGSGKTTLCNLVARFYDPTAGRILLDGTDLREIDVASFRRLLGIVEQDVFLFDGTVAENIAYARRDATDEQVRAAAEAAAAHGFITGLEHGYQTLIGERGVKLSGGQKQRIAIARAVLADPRILILDEATSNLDSESEALIQRSLARLIRGRTCFVIAHRLSTIRHADRIVVLENGRVIEVGTHEQLLEREGRYADFLRLQLGQMDGRAADAQAEAEKPAGLH
ncbi:MAG: ABC transporter ATP-binding protein [Phycisphaerales bacterium]